MKVIVCGGRDFDDVEFLVQKLHHIHELNPITHVITGAAKGADDLGNLWADEMGIDKTSIPANWNKYGKKAGMIRNKEMLDEGPDLVIAFPSNGTGTQNTINTANKMGIPVWESKYVYFTKEDPNYGFCSNFAKGHGFTDDDGLYWDTTEHYYQAFKSPFKDEQEQVRQCKTAHQAKILGGKINMREDWEAPPWEEYGGHKEVVMNRALSYKFGPKTKAAELLLCTGDDYLVEYAPWGDVYWGVDRYKNGLNRLGKALMARRDQLFMMLDD